MFHRPAFSTLVRAGAAGLCGYEVAALYTPFLPTFSELSHRHRDWKGRLVVGLAVAVLLHHLLIEA